MLHRQMSQVGLLWSLRVGSRLNSYVRLRKNFINKLCWTTWKYHYSKQLKNKIEMYNIEYNKEINVEVSLGTIMEESLTKIVELPKFISFGHMITIKDLARIKWQLSLCKYFITNIFICIYICLEFRHEVECCNYFDSELFKDIIT